MLNSVSSFGSTSSFCLCPMSMDSIDHWHDHVFKLEHVCILSTSICSKCTPQPLPSRSHRNPRIDGLLIKPEQVRNVDCITTPVGNRYSHNGLDKSTDLLYLRTFPTCTLFVKQNENVECGRRCNSLSLQHWLCLDPHSPSPSSHSPQPVSVNMAGQCSRRAMEQVAHVLYWPIGMSAS